MKAAFYLDIDTAKEWLKGNKDKVREGIPEEPLKIKALKIAGIIEDTNVIGGSLLTDNNFEKEYAKRQPLELKEFDKYEKLSKNHAVVAVLISEEIIDCKSTRFVQVIQDSMTILKEDEVTGGPYEEMYCNTSDFLNTTDFKLYPVVIDNSDL